MSNFQILLLCTSKEKKEAGQGQVFNPQFGKSISYLNTLNFPYSFSCSLSDYKIQHILSQFFFNFFQIFSYMSNYSQNVLYNFSKSFSMDKPYSFKIFITFKLSVRYCLLVRMKKTLLLSPSHSEIPVRIIKNVTNDMLRKY